ncbi:MAG TPA: RsmB/NOP family class I SAM-dependent RNA methyltransferase [Firmicutes bacterium]|nr:RsmB/NOP family class I SAM-dependent RNA methyltransferase [Bacillota bacterium]HHY97621.1 RsmB/NOP family class I SAM-dependent RNA methyltransferase [Bacillota bacterium]
MGKIRYSIRQTAERLPREFVDRLYLLFGPSIADKILHGFGAARFTTLRVNTLRSDIRSVMRYLRDLDVKFDRVQWYDLALVIKNKRERDLEGLDIYKQGHIYLQSLSSMIPPLVLVPEPGEKVLDMAAAPGSKTAQMAMMMGNQGYILANDINSVRAKVLEYNIRVQGVEIVEISIQDGASLGKAYPEYFDKVLLDAPCSGEGLFLAHNPRTYAGWNTKKIKQFASLQRRLLESAVKALKPGGILVYSTCTLSPEENEENIAWLLENHAESVTIDEIPLSIPERVNGIVPPDDMRKCMRILPSDTMEGFFVCKLRKRLT